MLSSAFVTLGLFIISHSAARFSRGIGETHRLRKSCDDDGDDTPGLALGEAEWGELKQGGSSRVGDEELVVGRVPLLCPAGGLWWRPQIKQLYHAPRKSSLNPLL
jgi:hypothetical protein